MDEDVVVVANGQHQVFHVVQRIAAQVDFTTLTLGDHDAVVTDAGMFGAETTYRHRLHAPCPTIVAKGDARQTVKGIGHIGDTHRQHVSTIQQAYRSRTRQRVLASGLSDGNLVQLVYPAGNSVRLCHST